jgi:hypothetical protein
MSEETIGQQKKHLHDAMEGSTRSPNGFHPAGWGFFLQVSEWQNKSCPPSNESSASANGINKSTMKSVFGSVPKARRQKSGRSTWRRSIRQLYWRSWCLLRNAIFLAHKPHRERGSIMRKLFIFVAVVFALVSIGAGTVVTTALTSDGALAQAIR